MSQIKDLNCIISDGNYSSKYPKQSEFIESGIPFIRANNMKDNTIISKDMYYISPEKHAELKKGHLKTGDVLIVTRGSIGLTAVVPEEFDDANINAQIVLIRCDNKTINNRYLLWNLNSKKVRKQILKLQTGSTLKQLPVGKVNQIEIIDKEYSEQVRIANELDNLTGLLKNMEEELKDLDSLILDTIQKEIIDKKEQFKVDSLGNYFNITSSKRVFQSEWKESGVPFYRAREIVKLVADGTVNNELFISEEMYEEYKNKYGIPKENDLMVTGVGTLGICYLVTDTDKFYFKDGNIIWLKTKNMINSKYISYLYKTRYIKNQIESGSAGATVGTYTIEKAKATNIIIPDDNTINNLMKYITKIEKQKELLKQNIHDIKKLIDIKMLKYFE